jgi:hypothetical protein
MAIQEKTSEVDYATDSVRVRDHRSAMDEPPASAQPLALPENLDESTVLLSVIARAASDRTIDIDRMERLVAIHERMQLRRAEQQFIEAMTAFKQAPPRILKDKHVSFPHRNDGDTTDYWHATLGAVCAAAVAGLAKVGISHRWDLKQLDGGRVEVTCVLTHVGGHSKSTTLSGSPDASGKKNNIQQVASTITYLERYTLLACTGLATEAQDNDGAGDGEVETLNEEQLANVEALLTEIGEQWRKPFLKYMAVDSMAGIPASEYAQAIQALQDKRRSVPAAAPKTEAAK